MSGQEFHITVEADEARAIDVLSSASALPKQRLKDALNKGAVWLRPGGRGSEQRLRRATRNLRRGDRISLYYDAELLQREAPPALLIADERDYSIWHKPAGMLAQGTRYGDHCALLRWCEQAFPSRNHFLVHRLDREAEGLMLIAHQRKAADLFSGLWQRQQISKRYEVMAEGRLGEVGHAFQVDTALDGKDSITEFRVRAFNQEQQRSVLDVTLITGRKHQIRRHLAGIGHPVVGDYRYGSRDRRAEPLALRAVRLQFRCPLSGRERNYEIDSAFDIDGIFAPQPTAE